MERGETAGHYRRGERKTDDRTARMPERGRNTKVTSSSPHVQRAPRARHNVNAAKPGQSDRRVPAVTGRKSASFSNKPISTAALPQSAPRRRGAAVEEAKSRIKQCRAEDARDKQILAGRKGNILDFDGGLNPGEARRQQSVAKAGDAGTRSDPKLTSGGTEHGKGRDAQVRSSKEDEERNPRPGVATEEVEKQIPVLESRSQATTAATEVEAHGVHDDSEIYIGGRSNNVAGQRGPGDSVGGSMKKADTGCFCKKRKEPRVIDNWLGSDQPSQNLVPPNLNLVPNQPLEPSHFVEHIKPPVRRGQPVPKVSSLAKQPAGAPGPLDPLEPQPRTQELEAIQQLWAMPQPGEASLHAPKVPQAPQAGVPIISSTPLYDDYDGGDIKIFGKTEENCAVPSLITTTKVERKADGLKALFNKLAGKTSTVTECTRTKVLTNDREHRRIMPLAGGDAAATAQNNDSFHLVVPQKAPSTAPKCPHYSSDYESDGEHPARYAPAIQPPDLVVKKCNAVRSHNRNMSHTKPTDNPQAIIAREVSAQRSKEESSLAEFISPSREIPAHDPGAPEVLPVKIKVMSRSQISTEDLVIKESNAVHSLNCNMSRTKPTDNPPAIITGEVSLHSSKEESSPAEFILPSREIPTHDPDLPEILPVKIKVMSRSQISKEHALKMSLPKSSLTFGEAHHRMISSRMSDNFDTVNEMPPVQTTKWKLERNEGTDGNELMNGRANEMKVKSFYGDEAQEETSSCEIEGGLEYKDLSANEEQPEQYDIPDVNVAKNFPALTEHETGNFNHSNSMDRMDTTTFSNTTDGKNYEEDEHGEGMKIVNLISLHDFGDCQDIKSDEDDLHGAAGMACAELPHDILDDVIPVTVNITMNITESPEDAKPSPISEDNVTACLRSSFAITSTSPDIMTCETPDAIEHTEDCSGDATPTPTATARGTRGIVLHAKSAHTEFPNANSSNSTTRSDDSAHDSPRYVFSARAKSPNDVMLDTKAPSGEMGMGTMARSETCPDYAEMKYKGYNEMRGEFKSFESLTNEATATNCYLVDDETVDLANCTNSAVSTSRTQRESMTANHRTPSNRVTSGIQSNEPMSAFEEEKIEDKNLKDYGAAECFSPFDERGVDDTPTMQKKHQLILGSEDFGATRFEQPFDSDAGEDDAIARSSITDFDRMSLQREYEISEDEEEYNPEEDNSEEEKDEDRDKIPENNSRGSIYRF